MNLQILDQKHLILVDALGKFFKDYYKGFDNAIKTDELLLRLKQAGFTTSGAQLRLVIGHIRQHDLLAPCFIVSDVNYGYWLTDNEDELNSFLDKQLNRMSNQFQNVKSLHQRLRYAKKTIEIQPQLF